MSAAKSNSELIACYLDAVIHKDASAVDSYFDPNAEYMVNGTLETDADGALPAISAECHSALPWLGRHRGREAVKEFLSHVLDVLDHCKPTSLRKPITCNWPETNMFYFSFNLESRRVSLAGITRHPDEAWMRQMACNATWAGMGQLNGCRYWLDDRDAKFGAEVRETLAAGGVTGLRLPPRSPKLERCCGALGAIG
jgi:hypothetical protein